MAARRVLPVVAYTVCCVEVLTLVIAPDITTAAASEFAGQPVPPILLPSALVFPVLLYAVAAYSARPWPLVALLVGLVGAALTTVRLWTLDGLAGQAAQGGIGWRLFVLAALVAVVLAPFGLGRFSGVRASYVEALEERALHAERDRAERTRRAVAAEWARIAREMHDVVAHSLAVIVRQAEGGRFAGGKDPQLAVQVLAAVAATGREALSDMRTVLGVLRRDSWSETDEYAEGTPQPTVDDVPALVERLPATGLTVALRVSGTALPLDRAASLAAYRVVQEALTNVVKHAGRGASAEVRLDWRSSGLDITVTDDGDSQDDGAVAGGDPFDGRAEQAGQGLVGMRERVALVGGDLSAGPRKGYPEGSGFIVTARLPALAGEPPAAGVIPPA